MGKKELSRKKELFLSEVTLALFLIITFLVINFVSAVDPVGPDSIDFGSNETKTNTSSAYKVNLSGGRILAMNITSSTQNPRWKAFVGNVIGSFTLTDNSGSIIYDWSGSSVTGRIYTTRTSGVVSWINIACANVSEMEVENTALNHTGSGDNITATFGNPGDSNHSLFWVGTIPIAANSCPTLHTYVNNASQNDSFFEMALEDGASNIVYATIIEENETGYDGESYDFQMIVPEVATPSFNSSTAYYLYVELGS